MALMRKWLGGHMRASLAGVIVAVLFATAFVVPGGHLPGVRGQTIVVPSGNAGAASASASVDLVPGETAVLAADPASGDPATLVTVTISGDQITDAGTATLSTALNEDGSVSGNLDGGPPGATATACLGQDASNCVTFTLDGSGSGSFTLVPQES